MYLHICPNPGTKSRGQGPGRRPGAAQIHMLVWSRDLMHNISESGVGAVSHLRFMMPVCVPHYISIIVRQETRCALVPRLSLRVKQSEPRNPKPRNPKSFSLNPKSCTVQFQPQTPNP